MKFQTTKPIIAAHSIYVGDETTLKEAKALAQEHNLIFHIHASETRGEVTSTLQKYKKRPIEVLDDWHLLDDKTLLAHGSWASQREIRIVAEKRSAIASCPVSNLKLATGGIAPLEEYEKASVPILLGTDGAASNNGQDMFETIKATSLLQKHKYWKANAAKATAVLKWATYNGSFIDEKLGCLGESCYSDLLILKPKFISSNHALKVPSETIVYAPNTLEVWGLMINGAWRIKDGKFINERLLKQALDTLFYKH